MAIAGLGSGMAVYLKNVTDTVDYKEVISLSWTGANVGVTDLGSANSTSDCADFAPNIIDVGSFTAVLRMGSTLSTADANLTTLHATMLARSIESWALYLSDGSGTDATITVNGFITHVGTRSHYKGGTQTTVTIKCTGVPVYAAAAE